MVVQSSDATTLPVGGVGVLELNSHGTGSVIRTGTMLADFLRCGVLSVQVVFSHLNETTRNEAMEKLQNFLKMLQLGKINEQFFVSKFAEEGEILVLNVCRIASREKGDWTISEVQAREG